MLPETIQRLRDVILDPNCAQMNKSTVVGYLGEILVREKLLSEGHQVEHKGNQSGYDLSILGGPKIDVKACTPRGEFGLEVDFWGWALLSETKKKKVTFSHLVCVAFTRSLDVHKFYVIKTEALSYFPPSSRRFKGVLRSYNVFDAVPELNSKSAWYEVRQGCERAEASGYVSAVSPNQTLSDFF